MRSRKPERLMLRVDDVIPNPLNDQIHPALQIEMLKESILAFGQPRPVLVRKANRMLISGHGIWQTLRELGRPDIDCLVWDVPQSKADQYLVADNRFTELSNTDPERRRELLEGLSENDFGALGFTAEEVAALFDGGQPISVMEIETGEVGDHFWINVRGPLAQQPKALKRLQEFMAEFPDVTIDLGTMPG
jgi:hypothetical protein